MSPKIRNISCIDIADRLGIKKGDKENIYYCPNSLLQENNDENPSFVIYDSRCKCMLCDYPRYNGKWANNVQLVMHEKQLSAHGAIKWFEENYEFNGKIKKSNDNQEKKYLLCRICSNTKHRFAIRDESELELNDPEERDMLEIWFILGKSYHLDTLLKAGVKINHKDLITRMGKSLPGYALAFSLGKDSITFNPSKKRKCVYVKRLFDYLTAIEMNIDEEYGLVLYFNNEDDLNLLGVENIFILDYDAEVDFDRICIPYNINKRIKIIKLPGEYKNLGKYYHNLERNAKLDLYEIFDRTPFPEFAKEKSPFWTINEKGIQIDRIKFLESIRSDEIYRYRYPFSDLHTGLVYMGNNKIQEISIDYMKNHVKNYLKSLKKQRT